jgi:dihydrofolate reductase
MRLNLIYARARNGVIGRDGTLPWRLPQDLAHFKGMTAQCPVIMGRKTWDSLPPRFRPLPGRLNLVLTRQVDWRADGAQPVGSLEQALQVARRLEPVPAEAWVIGGAQLYALALPLASRAVVTELELEAEGDTFAPPLAPHWIESSRAQQTSPEGLRFAFVHYTNTAISQES